MSFLPSLLLVSNAAGLRLESANTEGREPGHSGLEQKRLNWKNYISRCVGHQQHSVRAELKAL